MLTLSEALPAAARTTAAFREEYPFQPRFLAQPGGLQHYVDEGPQEAPAVLCVHGNPTWSFLYRRVVEALAPTRRVVAPDHLSCGLRGHLRPKFQNNTIFYRAGFMRLLRPWNSIL